MSALPTPQRAPVAWTPQADAIIRRCHGRIPNRRIAAALGRTAQQVVGRAKQLGLIVARPWTERETALLRRHYRPDDPAATDALAAVLGRPRRNVAEKARSLGLGRGVPRWTAEQDAALRWHFGYKSDAALGRQIGRSANAARERAFALRLRRHQPFSATDAARIVGWDWHKLVGYGAEVGLRRSVRGQCRTNLDIDVFERFLVGHCHEIDPARMADPSGYYERIVRQARDADPLLTVPEVAKRLGVSCDRIRRLIRAGRIAALHAPNAGATGTYYVRQSAAHYEHLRRGWPKGKPRGKAGAS